jgi:hypothetical protein
MYSKTLNLVAAIAFSAAMLGTAYAETDASAAAQVYLHIEPNIAVQAVDHTVDLGTLETGEVSAPITFRIDANTQSVKISGLVTKLYKGDDPSGEVAPVEVNTNKGFLINPTHAHQIQGGDGIASYTGTSDYNGFAAYTTEALTFESGQNGRFSQEVDVTPTWFNNDPEKPQGEYSGFVVLYSSALL